MFSSLAVMWTDTRMVKVGQGNFEGTDSPKTETVKVGDILRSPFLGECLVPQTSGGVPFGNVRDCTTQLFCETMSAIPC